jgi:hypothetical protein
VGLVDGDDPTGANDGASGGQYRFDLGVVVRIVVVYANPSHVTV